MDTDSLFFFTFMPNSVYNLYIDSKNSSSRSFVFQRISTIDSFPQMPIARFDKTWRQTIQDAWVSGSAASIASTICLSLLGKAELNRLAAPINGPSQWIWGRYAPYENRFSLRYTLVGYLIHHAASVFWATLYEKLRQRMARADAAPAVMPAAVTTVAAYIVDFHFTPKRLTPGFEHRLSKRALLMVYGSFAIGLAAVALGDRYRRDARSRPPSPTCQHLQRKSVSKEQPRSSR